MVRSRVALAALSAALVSLAEGCTAGAPPPPPTTAQQPATASTYAPAPAPAPAYAPTPAPAHAPAPAASQAAPAPLGPTDPGTLQAILQGIQGALMGQMVTPAAIASDVTDTGLKVFALRAAPGMPPEGDELKQTLAEGQHAVMMVTMQAGKCYAILGFSPLGAVKDLDLSLLPPPYLTLAGQDLAHHNTPSLGAAPSPMCPVIPFPIQYKLDVFAKSGSGPVAVQLYSKTSAPAPGGGAH